METRMNYQIENLSPSSLDDVIRANRDKCRLAFATDEELRQLNGRVSDSHEIWEVTSWQVIVIHITQDDGATVDNAYLVGTLCDEPWRQLMSCRIVSVDLKLGLIETSCSDVYHVDGRKLADERFINLNHICTELHDMGLGRKYGVPNPAEDI